MKEERDKYMKSVMTIINEENESGKYEIFSSFDAEMTGKSYVIYTGYYENENKQLVLNAGSYEIIDEDTIRVDRNLTPEEHKMLTDIMNNILAQFEKLAQENRKNEETENI
mgnify:CR=1 FL=1|jgi:uncharacterized protein YrzB (UPF0473 family)